MGQESKIQYLTFGFLILFIATFVIYITVRRNNKQFINELNSTPTITRVVTTSENPTIPQIKECTYEADPANTSVYNSKAIQTVSNLRWFRQGDPKSQTVGGAASSPIVVCDTLYFSNWDGYIYALHANTGELLWRFKPEAKPVESPTFADEYIYFADVVGNFYAVDTKSQQEVWRYSLKTEKNGRDLFGSRHITSSPIVYDNTVYFPDNSGYLYALDAKEGNERWIFEKATVFYFTQPAISEGAAYFGDDDGTLYAVEAETGVEKWSQKFTDSLFVQPTIYNNKVYVISDDGVLHALQIGDGKEIWNYRYVKTDTFIRVDISSVAAFNNAIYLSGTNDYFLDVLDSETGKEIWKFQAESWVETQPVITDNVVYFGTLDRKDDRRSFLYAVDINSQEELWKYKIISLGIRGKPFVLDGALYFSDGVGGNLYALE